MRILRVAVAAVLASVAVLALLVGGTWLFLQTSWGGDTVRRLVLPRVNATIAGRLDLGRFAFGGDRVTLEDLVLRDPDGAVVGSVERLDLAFFPLSLLRGRVDVRALEVRRPDLRLVTGVHGSNLSRALAPRKAQPKQARPPGTAGVPAGSVPFPIDLRQLTVLGGRIDYRAGDRRVHLADLDARGTARLAGDVLALDTTLGVRGGRVWTRGQIDVRRLRAVGPGLIVRGSGIDVAKLMDGAPSSDLAFELRGRGNRFELAHLLATLPGATVTGSGTLAPERADVQVEIVASDLAATARSIRAGGRPTATPLAGSGRLEIAVEGPPAAPTVRLSGRAPFLRVGDRTFRSLAVVARADRGRLEALTLRYPEATWTLERPARIELGGERVIVENLMLRAHRQRITLDLRRDGKAQRGRVTLAHFDLGRLPRALVPEALGLAGLVDLDARFAGTTDSPEVDGKLSLTGGRLRGHRDLALELEGRLTKARGSGRLAARWLGTALAARFDLPAGWPIRNRQVPALLDLDLAETDLASLFKAVGDTSGRPAAPRAGSIRGRVRLSARLDGTGSRPRLAVAAAARGLFVGAQQVGDITLNVSGDGNRPLRATLEVDGNPQRVPEPSRDELRRAKPASARRETTALAGALARTSIAIQTPLSLRDLIRRPPTVATLTRTPVEVRGDIDRFPLAVVGRLARHPQPVGGTISSHIELSGTARDPKGRLTADVAGATTGQFPPTDARFELDLEGRSIEACARVTRKRRALLAAVVKLGADLAALRRPDLLADAPVEAKVVLGPLAMARLGLPPESDRDPPRALKGGLHADLTVDGTLRAPRLVFHARANNIRLDRSLVGFGRVELTYADRKAMLDAQLQSANGGTMHAIAETAVDLGYPAITRGLDVRRLPLEARLDAQHFDLQGLSGAMQQLRTVAGLLDASTTVRGTIGDPRLEGRLEWSRGIVAVTGFGEYKDIHLLLRGNRDKLVLEELAANSGAGHARVAGHATHAPGVGYRFDAKADLKKFPVYSEGQALAAVTVACKLDGTAAPSRASVSVEIDQARIELSEAKRKRLQSLEVPADIVLVEDGKPLNPTQAKRLQALDQRQRQAGAAPAAARGPQAARPPPEAPSIEVRVTAPRQLWVTGKDAHLELGLSRGFRIQKNDRALIFGRVVVHRGRIDVVGRRFDVQRDSTLRWTGPADRPELDVRALHKNERENVSVLLTAKGPLDRLTIAVTSPNRPELTESQLYTLIITGRLQLAGGTSGSASPSAQGLSLLGGVLAAQLQKTLANKLPLDVLTISAGSDGLRGTQLEAGRYVSDKVYVGYVGRVGADPLRYQNRNAVHLEYQLTRRWEIEGEYGDVGTGTVDLMWKKNY